MSFLLSASRVAASSSSRAKETEPLLQGHSACPGRAQT